MLNWISRFSIFAFLEQPPAFTAPGKPLIIAGAGVAHSLQCGAGQALADLERFRQQYGDWCFGHLSYDLKSETAGSPSEKADPTGFPQLAFFVPQIVLQVFVDRVEIGCIGQNPQGIAADIQDSSPTIAQSSLQTVVKPVLSKEEYMERVEKLRAHILRGDCYEINFCQEYASSAPGMDPLPVYAALSELSPNPFSALYRWEQSWLLCASPERFLRKEGRRLISEPMKGTMPRDRNNPDHDAELKTRLAQSAKDRAENIMVVDLVRNDLSRCCSVGSVVVEELCEVYSFPQVHQMISRITGQLPEGRPAIEAIRCCFPMGSMTGAPKQRVLELIEQYEPGCRGIFSGALGYFNADDDFDFNVVIRSLLYNAHTGHLRFLVGSGITYASDAGREYEECEWKAEAIKKVISYT